MFRLTLVFISCLIEIFSSRSYSATGVRAGHRVPVALGSDAAVPGGDFRIRYASEPFSLNPITAGTQSVEIQFYAVEGLLLQNEQTYAWQPWLADRWKVSADGKIHEFHIRENAAWSDGKPLTSEDVKFSFDVLFNDQYPTAQMRPFYESIDRVEIVDRKTVRFVTKSSYYGNFFSTAGLPIVPKHIYGDPKTGPNINKTIVGSGPYKFDSWNEGRNIILKKNELWWGWKDPLYKGKFMPERVVFQFVTDENVALEMLKKGTIDYMSLTTDEYLLARKAETKDSPFKTERVRALYPQPVSSIGFNLRRPLFQDKRVRLALAHLVDRDMMLKKFFDGFMVEATGPWYEQSEFADPSVKPIRYDPGEALRLLKEAGWSELDRDGLLKKVIDGQKQTLRFQIITSSKPSERWLTVFKEDASKVGVDIEIKTLNSNAFGAILDTKDFDAADLTSGGWMVEFDPKPGWYSTSAERGGLNFIGFQSPEVDRLIDRAHVTYDFQKRIPIMREIYKRIADDVPEIFLFNGADSFYAYSKRVGRAAPTYNYDTGLKFWWIKKGAQP